MNTRPRKNFIHSLGYATRGVVDACRIEKHMKVHLIAAIAAVVALVIRHATKEDILFVSLAITLVWVTEMINTAIEKAVDLAMPEQHPVAKLAKDVAAGAVLLAAVFAVVVAILVFVG